MRKKGWVSGFLPPCAKRGCCLKRAMLPCRLRRALANQPTIAHHHRNHPSPIATFSTPRRLVVHVPALLTQQPDKVEEILGPPVKVAIDAQGKYTRAAESFAQKNSVGVEDLARTTTPKGEYLSLRKTTPGRPALEILAEILPGAILGLTFPKSMYWTEKSAPRFVRPIRWVVCLLGEGKNAATVEFQFLGVKSGNFTLGHRARSRKSIPVSGFKDYVRKLKQAIVEIDYDRRNKRVTEESKAVLGETAGKIIPDDWLTDWIANSTEWPRPMLGSFDERFLHLPREILITVMRDHQRYFAVENVGPSGARPLDPPLPPDSAGHPDPPQLAPHFVAVLNMDSDEKGLIRQGHERVLTARFRDAEFFWNADQKLPLRDRIPLLDKVTYQAKLGSYGDKIRRMNTIAEYLCERLDVGSKNVEPGFSPAPDAHEGATSTPSATPGSAALKDGATFPAAAGGTDAQALRQHVLRAVDLCKCDLTAQMVQEFTELQGIVGGLYAKAQGEPEEVATAIYDHYLPLGVEGSSPRTLVGALVSLADKLDTVVGGFVAGLEPTGSRDPFALRRAGNGIIRILSEFNIPIDIAILEMYSLITHGRSAIKDVHFDPIRNFLDERFKFYLETIGECRHDTVRAVMALGTGFPADELRRARALEKIRDTDDYLALAQAAKRTRNILRKSASDEDYLQGTLNPDLFREEAEVELYKAYASVFHTASGQEVAANDYETILALTARLRPAIDKFFDQVLVMHEDAAIRKNRLLLLAILDQQVFSRVADLSEIGSNVDASTLTRG